MSGNAAAPYNDYLKNPLAQARLQAKYLGIPRWNRLTSAQLIAALRRVNAIDILEAGDKFKVTFDVFFEINSIFCSGFILDQD